MNAARPKVPGTNRGHAGLAIARVPDCRGTIGIIIMVRVMTTAVGVTVGRPAHIMVPANDLTVHGQDGRAKDGWIGAASGNNGSIARYRASRRRLALSAITGGQS